MALAVSPVLTASSPIQAAQLAAALLGATLPGYTETGAYSHGAPAQTPTGAPGAPSPSGTPEDTQPPETSEATGTGSPSAVAPPTQEAESVIHLSYTTENVDGALLHGRGWIVPVDEGWVLIALPLQDDDLAAELERMLVVPVP